jgi:hypothetical protein
MGFGPIGRAEKQSLFRQGFTVPVYRGQAEAGVLAPHCFIHFTGRMWVNTYNDLPAGAPFGGYKQSGIGRETHKVILEHYSQLKNIYINLKEGVSGMYDIK